MPLHAGSALGEHKIPRLLDNQNPLNKASKLVHNIPPCMYMYIIKTKKKYLAYIIICGQNSANIINCQSNYIKHDRIKFSAVGEGTLWDLFSQQPRKSNVEHHLYTSQCVAKNHF